MAIKVSNATNTTPREGVVPAGELLRQFAMIKLGLDSVDAELFVMIVGLLGSDGPMESKVELTGDAERRVRLLMRPSPLGKNPRFGSEGGPKGSVGF